MAYDLPTVADFRTKFPELEADLEDSEIQALLDEAARSVDDTWTAGDFKNAILYLAAHNQMTMANTAAFIDGDQLITSESIGGISVSYSTAGVTSSANSSSICAGSEYGQRYLALLRKNIPAFTIV